MNQLAFDDFHVRIVLDIEVAGINPRVLLKSRQTHRGRIVVVLNDLGLNRHAGTVNPNFRVLVARFSLRNERQMDCAYYKS